jgi:hypothetical protein
LLLEGKYAEVTSIVNALLKLHTSSDGTTSGTLSRFGLQQVRLVSEWGAIARLLQNGPEGAADEFEASGESTPYATLICDVLYGDPAVAMNSLTEAFEHGDLAQARDYALELSIIEDRRGKDERAVELLDEWSHQARSTNNWHAAECAILRVACAKEILSEPVRTYVEESVDAVQA